MGDNQTISSHDKGTTKLYLTMIRETTKLYQTMLREANKLYQTMARETPMIREKIIL